MGRIRQLALVATLVTLTACNPVLFDPGPSYPGFKFGRVRVSGPEPMWVEAAVVDVDGYAVYGMAAVHHDHLVGPGERLCVDGAEVVSCEESFQDVRQPQQSYLPDSSWRRMMQVWPGEPVDLWLVCIDDVSQDLACPDSLRLLVRTVNESGDLVGDMSVMN